MQTQYLKQGFQEPGHRAWRMVTHDGGGGALRVRLQNRKEPESGSWQPPKLRRQRGGHFQDSLCVCVEGQDPAQSAWPPAVPWCLQPRVTCAHVRTEAPERMRGNRVSARRAGNDTRSHPLDCKTSKSMHGGGYSTGSR